MTLTNDDVQTIWDMIRAIQTLNEVTYGKVTKRDEKRKLIWLADYGDQPIPVCGLEYEASFYDDDGTTVTKKTVKATPIIPKVGDLVVVLRQFGDRRLPKCVGVVLSKGGFQGVS